MKIHKKEQQLVLQYWEIAKFLRPLIFSVIFSIFFGLVYSFGAALIVLLFFGVFGLLGLLFEALIHPSRVVLDFQMARISCEKRLLGIKIWKNTIENADFAQIHIRMFNRPVDMSKYHLAYGAIEKRKTLFHMKRRSDMEPLQKAFMELFKRNLPVI